MSSLVEVTVIAVAPNAADPVTFQLHGELVAPGLALTPAVLDGTYHGGWVLTHTGSGRAVAPKAACLPCTRAVAVKVAALGIDWTRPMDVVIADKRAEKAGRLWSYAIATCAGWCCTTTGGA